MPSERDEFIHLVLNTKEENGGERGWQNVTEEGCFVPSDGQMD